MIDIHLLRTDPDAVAARLKPRGLRHRTTTSSAGAAGIEPAETFSGSVWSFSESPIVNLSSGALIR